MVMEWPQSFVACKAKALKAHPISFPLFHIATVLGFPLTKVIEATKLSLKGP